MEHRIYSIRTPTIVFAEPPMAGMVQITLVLIWHALVTLPKRVWGGGGGSFRSSVYLRLGKRN